MPDNPQPPADDMQTAQQLFQQLAIMLQQNNNNNQSRNTDDSFSKVRLREPDVFSGDHCDQQVVDGWLRSIERHQEFHNWNATRTVSFAVTFLTNHADIWYRTLEQQDAAPTHWIEFKNAFISKFRPGNAYDLARDKLVALKQTSTISDYIQKFANTIILIPEMHRLESYDAFMRGLKNTHDLLFAELRSVELDDRTMDLAYRKAAAFESSHVFRDAAGKIISAPIRPAVPYNSQYHHNNNDPMDLDVLHQRQQYQQSNNSSSSPASWRKNKFNNNNNKSYNNNNNNFKKNNNSKGGYPPCRLCSQMGHGISNCPLLEVVIAAVNSNKNGMKKFAVNSLQQGPDSEAHNNNNSNGSINNNNKNDSNHYSHTSSFNNTSNINPNDSMGNATTIINSTVNDHPATNVSSVSHQLNTSSTFTDNKPPLIPMELVPVVLPQSQVHSELNYVMQLNSVSGSLPLYRAIAGNNNSIIKVLIDCGASDNYVSSKLVDLIASNVTTVPGREVETADGGVTVINKEAVLDLNLGGYVCQVSSFVFPTKFDLILGRTWLKQHCPMPNWVNDQWTLGNGSDAVRLTPITNNDGEFTSSVSYNYGDMDTVRPQLSYLISKKQVNNYLRDGASGYLLYMKDDMLPEPTSSRHVLSVGHEGKDWLSKFLKEFHSVFSDALPGLPPDSGFQHVINLQPDAKPVNRAPYKMSPAELDELQKQLKELLDLGLIRKSTSPYGSPVLFVRKPDGSMRMCIDYRALNSLTIRNSNPLPRIDECFDRLQGASYFSSLDLKSGYHQIRIQESDIPKTAFNTRYGKWEWLVLPFGLCNAPPSFQAQMNSILGDYIDKFCLVYLDDICIFSRSLEEHKKHLRLVFEKLQKHNLIVNTKKCTFAQRELTFLGFQINSQGILPSPSKVKAIQDWKILTNVQEVRSFIGLAQHYRRFIPSFADIASPLTDLTKGTGSKRRPVTWTPECQISFDKIKKLLTTSPVLLLPDMSKPFRIECDASDYGVGAVLLQPIDNSDLNKSSSWHPVAYESKKLSSAERNYPAQERELLGVLHALRTWECFVDGCRGGYQVFTDHQPLQYLRSQAKPTPRLVRWLSELESYSPDIVYKSGKTNIVPDFLSRVGGADCPPANESFEPKYLYAADSHAAATGDQNKDLSLELQQDWPLLYRFQYDKKVQTPKLKVLLEGERDNFVINADQRIFRKVKLKVDTGKENNDGEQVSQIKEVPFVPFVDRVDLVEKYHTGFGHAGVKNMVNMFESRYWWPTMRRDITFWIKTCTSCQVNSAKSSKHQDVMHPLDVPEAFARWHLDFIGELPTTFKGNKWIITAVDSLTNWPIARAVPVASAEAVADFLYEEIVMRFGCPAEIITDRGSNLTSNIVKSYVHRMGTNHKLTSAFHPRTNSKVERFNGIIKPMLRKYVNGAIHRWDDFLETALWACRIRKHTTTGNSPFKLTYGREPRLPGDALRPYIDSGTAKDPRTVADFTARELEALGQLRAAAEFRVKAVNERDKEKWDANIKPVSFEPGDLVMITNEGRYGLEPIYRGPYVVLQYFPEFGTYKLETVEGKPLDSLIHVDRLKKAHGEKPVEPWYEPSSLLRRPVINSESAGNFSGPSSSSRPMNKPIIIKSSNNNSSSGGYSSTGHVNLSSDDNNDITQSSSFISPSSSPIIVDENNDDQDTFIIDKDTVEEDDVIGQQQDSILIRNNDDENDPIQDDDVIQETTDDAQVNNDNAVQDNDHVITQGTIQNGVDNAILIQAIVDAVMDYNNNNNINSNQNTTADEIMFSSTSSVSNHSSIVVDEVVSLPDNNEPMVDITSQFFVPSVVDDQLIFTHEDQIENNDNEINMENNTDNSTVGVAMDFDDNVSEYYDASDDDEHVEHGENVEITENVESVAFDQDMTSEHSEHDLNTQDTSLTDTLEISQFENPDTHDRYEISHMEVENLKSVTENVVSDGDNNTCDAPSGFQELVIHSTVFIPPPAPRLTPVVTNTSTNSSTGRNSVTPPPIAQSPPPQSDFTFTRPVVSSVPIQEPPPSTSSLVNDTHQFRFEDVPGVTSVSKGGNVELEVASSTEESIEDTPEFIRKWNQHKTKRFRPVVPSSNRLSKKRRLGNTTKPPDS